MSIDQFAHLVKQASGQQAQQDVRFVFGHIASYDPATHRVRVIVPSWRDDQGNAVMTPWMPLGTGAVGAQYGVQFAPYGGATLQNITAGEQVVVQLFDRARGVSAVASMLFTEVHQPPGTNIQGGLQPGEYLIWHKSGSYQRFHANGDLETLSKGKTLITSTGDLDAATNGAVNINAIGTITATAPTFQINGNLMVSGTVTATGDVVAGTVSLEGHDHTLVQSGTNTSGPPVGGI